MNFQYNDGGREYCNLPISQHDCVARALTIAAGCASYQTIYARLLEIAPQMEAEGVNIHDASFISLMHEYGFTRVDGLTAMQDIPHGRVIACTTGHYTAIINGTIQDVRNEAGKAVSHYWVFGQRFDLWRNGVKLNRSSLNPAQALRMRAIFLTNYGQGVHLKKAE